MNLPDPYIYLNAAHLEPARLNKERQKARLLKKSKWWQKLLQKGICHYCGQRFSPAELTMDHIVPLARGGESQKSNVALACKTCNTKKKLQTPAEIALAALKISAT